MATAPPVVHRKLGSKLFALIAGTALLALAIAILFFQFDPVMELTPRFLTGGASLIFGLILLAWLLKLVGNDAVMMALFVVTALIAIFALAPEIQRIQHNPLVYRAGDGY